MQARFRFSHNLIKFVPNPTTVVGLLRETRLGREEALKTEKTKPAHDVIVRENLGMKSVTSHPTHQGSQVSQFGPTLTYLPHKHRASKQG